MLLKDLEVNIVYIPTPKGMVYMYAVVDLCGKMVLLYRIEKYMTSSLVIDTIIESKQK